MAARLALCRWTIRFTPVCCWCSAAGDGKSPQSTTTTKSVEVAPAAGGRPPGFNGGVAGVHDRVRAEMRSVLASQTNPPYLSATAASLLSEARAAYARYRLADHSILAGRPRYDPLPVDWQPGHDDTGRPAMRSRP